MLFTQNLISWLLACFRISKYLGYFQFDWNENLKQFIKCDEKTPFRIRKLKVLIALGALIWIVNLIQMLIYYKKITTTEKILSIYYTTTLFAFAYTELVLILKRDRFLEMINQAIRFERFILLPMCNKNLRDGATVKVIIVLSSSSFILLPIYTVGVWVFPCLPSHFGYFLFPQCHPSFQQLPPLLSAFANFAVKCICIVVISSTLMKAVYPGFVFEFLATYTITNCLKSYIKVLDR